MEQAKKGKYILEHVDDVLKFNQFIKDQFGGIKQVNFMTYDEIVQCVQAYRKDRGLDILVSTCDVPPLEKGEEIIYNKFRASQIEKDADFSRKSQITKKIEGANKSDLSLKQVNIEVVHPEVVKASGIFSSDFVMYRVQTTILETGEEYSVERKDQDFYSLRQVLCNLYPYTMVPYLPRDQKITKCADKDMRIRCQEYNRFLTGISRSEVLKSCKFLHQFLTLSDKKQLETEFKQLEKRKFSKLIEDVVSQEGQVSVEDRQDSIKFCDGIKTFQLVFSQITKEAIDLSKEVHELSDQLAQTIMKLSIAMKEMGQLYKRVKVQSQQKLFSKLSGILKETANHQKNQGYLTKIYLGQAMKYYDSEHMSLDEMIDFRNEFKLEYQKQADQLESKKNTLFKKDPRQWGYTNGNIQDLVAKHSQLTKDKPKAFKYMLTAETVKLQEQHEELCFYTNQCLDEVQRVGKDNGVALIDHFMDQGKIECDYLLQQYNRWSDFVGYFGSLAWDKSDSQDEDKKKVSKKKDDEFELIDEDGQIETKNEPQSQSAGAPKPTYFQLVEQNATHTTPISVFDAQANLHPSAIYSQARKLSHSSSNGSDRTMQTCQMEEKKDIAETLKRMLREEDDPVPQLTNTVIKNKQKKSEKDHLMSTGPSETASNPSTALFTPPTVTIKKRGKNRDNRRTAPNQVLTTQRLQRISNASAQVQLASERLTVGHTTSKQEKNTSESGEKVSSNSQSVSVPVLKESDSSNTDEQIVPISNKETTSLSNPNRGSSSQPSPNRISVGQTLQFEITYGIDLAQETIPEEEEKDSSGGINTTMKDTFVMNTTMKDTFVMDFDQHSAFGEPRDRFDTNAIGQRQEFQKAPMREQTITEQAKDTMLYISQQMESQKIEKQTKQKPKKVEPQNVQQILNSKRQSILTQNQVDKIIGSGQSGFNFPKLKPVAARKEETKETKKSKVDRSKETAIQRAIRHLQEGHSSSDDDQFAF